MEEKIAKLLSKAEATTNPHEADAYMAKAEELMLRFGIDRANLESKRPGTKRQKIVVKKIKIPNGHGYARAMVNIAHAVGPSFSLRTLQSNMSDGSRMAWLIGHSVDVDDAETLLNSLIIQSKAQAIVWWKQEGKPAQPWATNRDAYLARREFIYSFATGVRFRLSEIRNRVVEESITGTALVLVDRSKLVDRWVDENLKVGNGRSTHRRLGSHEASVAGNAAGRDAVSSRALKS